MRILTPAVLAISTLFVANYTSAQTVAVKPEYKFEITADRPEALYKVGEEATFTVKLLDGNKAASGIELNYTLSLDGHKNLSTGKTSSTEQAFTVKGKLDQPGFLRLTVTCKPEGQPVINGMGAVGYDPLQIKPSLPVPDDFDAFWIDQKKQLAAVPLNQKLTPVESKDPKVECFDLQVDCLGGKPVSGYFARPKNAAPKSLPAVLFVHGAGVRSSSLGGAMYTAGRIPALALDINAHGIPNGKPDDFYKALSDGELKGYPQQKRESRDTIYFRGMYLRLIRAIDFLCAQPEWDGKVVIVRGGSQGGGQSLAAAGLDSRVTAIWAAVPAICDHSGNVVDRTAGWPRIVPRGADGKPEPKALEAARYIDAMNFATRTKADAILSVGFIDGVCPPTSVYAAYNNLASPRKEMIIGIPYGHTVWQESNTRAEKFLDDHIARVKGTK